MTVITAEGRWLRSTIELRAAGYGVGDDDLRRPHWSPTACLCGVDVEQVLRRGVAATVVTSDGFYELGRLDTGPRPRTPHAP